MKLYPTKLRFDKTDVSDRINRSGRPGNIIYSRMSLSVFSFYTLTSKITQNLKNTAFDNTLIWQIIKYHPKWINIIPSAMYCKGKFIQKEMDGSLKYA